LTGFELPIVTFLPNEAAIVSEPLLGKKNFGFARFLYHFQEKSKNYNYEKAICHATVDGNCDSRFSTT
jgi:hypothetical protein